mmetsp:Transcript_1034/g.2239  ORF Transcript_1034/g.2239 Transcript_1034/m.2239 type:complete len:213 (+) Transcript_1034:1153-1791(+)
MVRTRGGMHSSTGLPRHLQATSTVMLLPSSCKLRDSASHTLRVDGGTPFHTQSCSTCSAGTSGAAGQASAPASASAPPPPPPPSPPGPPAPALSRGNLLSPSLLLSASSIFPALSPATSPALEESSTTVALPSGAWPSGPALLVPSPCFSPFAELASTRLSAGIFSDSLRARCKRRCEDSDVAFRAGEGGQLVVDAALHRARYSGVGNGKAT